MSRSVPYWDSEGNKTQSSCSWCPRNGSHQAESCLCVRKWACLWPRRRAEAWSWSDSCQSCCSSAKPYRLSVSVCCTLYLQTSEPTDIRIGYILSDRIQGRVLDVHSKRPNTAESWVTISPASLRNEDRMFLRVRGPSASASRVSLLAVSIPFYAYSWYTVPPY
jgi:hypothetical protein